MDVSNNKYVSVSAIGQDSHGFEPDDSAKRLILGGVLIPNCPGLNGNSDADVVLHALTNAISGISGQNILGKISDELCQNGQTDSRAYLEKAAETLSVGGWELTHASISIEAKRPHLADHIPAIKKSIASMLSLQENNIGLTATTGEGLTAFGRGEGIQAFAVVSACRGVDGLL
jgi:2-C-methyl-D-erythritol 2,4-cyclodiphosphate synthase